MKFKLPKIFTSSEDNSELMNEEMKTHQEEQEKEAKKAEKEAKKKQEKEDKTTNFLEAIGGGDDPYDTSVLEKVYKKYGSYIDKFNDKKKLPVKEKQDEINNYFDKKKQEKEQSDDTEDNEGNKKSTLDKVKGALETAGGAVVSGAKAAGKAIGKGAGAVGSAVSTGVGNLSKKLSHKNRFAEMEAKYDKFVEEHNKFLKDHGTDPIQKVFKDYPGQEYTYNKDTWLAKVAPLDLNKKTEIEKYQELANKILNYYCGDTKRGYQANINGNIDYYQKTTDQEGKAKAIKSIEQSLDNLFLQFGKVHEWFLEDGVADKAENVTENNGNGTEKQAENNLKEGAADKVENVTESNENEAEEQKDGVGDKAENVTESNENEAEEQKDGVGDKVENVTESNENEAEEQKEGALHKAKRVAGEVGSAVVEKGKAAGRGAKVLGNALLDKASGLKRTVGKKLKRKKSAPEASAPEASAPEADSKAVIVQGADKKVTKEDVKKQLLKVTDRYNRFLENYKKFAKKNKHSLKEMVKSVLPNGSENENWCNKGKYDEIKFEGLNSMSDLQVAWDNFMKDNLLGWLSGARRSEFEYIFKDISEKLEALDDERSADNRESIDDKKLEVMQAYDILARKILRYMQAVLARLNSTASEGIVGRTLKAMTKGDEETPEQEEAQEQKPRNLEEAFIIGEETDDEGKKELVYTNNSQVSKAFENAAKYFKEGSECDITKNQELVGYFSGIKGFKSAISSALKSTSLGAWSLYRKNAAGEKVKISSSRHSAMGVILISMAYLPGGSESILNACDGLKIGGIKATGGDDVITNASNVRKEIKKLALKGATGDKLVNKLKSSNAKTSLECLIDINALKQIMSKFGKLAKLKRKAVNEKAKAGKKIKDLKTAYREDGVKGVLKKINPFSKSKNKKGSKSDEQPQNENA